MPERARDGGGPAPLVVVAGERLGVLGGDGIVEREHVAGLQQAAALLDEARAQARRIVEQAEQAADARAQRAESEARALRDAVESELRAGWALDRARWLAELQPLWVAAMERALRQLCAETIRADVLAGALAIGLREFTSLAGVRIVVAPAELDAARTALARLDETPVPLRVDGDPALEPGRCQLRGHELEVQLDLEQAIAAVLGALETP